MLFASRPVECPYLLASRDYPIVDFTISRLVEQVGANATSVILNIIVKI